MLKKTLVAGALVLGLVAPTMAVAAPVPVVPINSVITQDTVALRDFAEDFGYKVVWNAETESAVVTKGNFHSVISLKNGTYEVNGGVINLSPAPQMKNGALHVAASFVGEFLAMQQKSNSITMLEAGKENKVTAGEKIAVELELNEGTGYRYEYVINQPMDVSALISPVNDVTVEKDDKGLVGSPAKYTWNFNALNPGEATISFYLYAPGNEVPVESVDYNVTIQDTNVVEIGEGESDVKKGDKISITLPLNPSTGYRYEVMVQQPMDIANLVTLESEEFAKLPADVVGTPTEKTWVYSAENEGTVYFDFFLYAPGEQTEPVETVRFKVNIK